MKCQLAFDKATSYITKFKHYKVQKVSKICRGYTEDSFLKTVQMFNNMKRLINLYRKVYDFPSVWRSTDLNFFMKMTFTKLLK